MNYIMDKPVMQNISITRKKKLVIFLVLCLTGVLIYLNSRLIPFKSYWASKHDLPLATIFPRHKHTDKIILYWNTFFGALDMSLGLGNDIFETCPFCNCFATNNKSYIPIQQFDAIVFHAPRYTAYDDGYPYKRSVHQKYIFYSMEAPYNINFDEITKKNYYNWTMTYRQDSDIYKPYGYVRNYTTNYEFPSVEEIKNKSKKVAWFVSNCQTEGSKRRMKYALELSKWISVDIYGQCGTLSCVNKTRCYEMLERDYKFYLSFENSMCKDYVTEKLFNLLEYNIIPIVLGFFDYSDIAPPKSVINTFHYKDPKDLAIYLYELDNNVTEYMKYFEWKKNHVIMQSNNNTICDLCKMLNMPITYSSYDNVEDWFYGFQCVL